MHPISRSGNLFKSEIDFCLPFGTHARNPADDSSESSGRRLARAIVMCTRVKASAASAIIQKRYSACVLCHVCGSATIYTPLLMHARQAAAPVLAVVRRRRDTNITRLLHTRTRNARLQAVICIQRMVERTSGLWVATREAAIDLDCQGDRNLSPVIEWRGENDKKRWKSGCDCRERQSDLWSARG